MAAKKKTDDPAMVWVVLTQTHDLPGMRLQPGRIRVSPELHAELTALGKLAE